mgnify:CR=1 FL=1|tara:strand:- start:20945 stop:22060 length:1116 start_codon:yes stop_codon:yes gene_type:complete
MNMSNSDHQKIFKFAALSAIKHAYVPLGVASHPRFEPVVVADDPDQGDWAHRRNQLLADQLNVPYIKNVQKALSEFGADVAVISSQAERHCDLAIRAAENGLHVIQDKPMSTNLKECDRAMKTVEKTGVKFMMWNRNFMPALVQTKEQIESGAIGTPKVIHIDFYFASDAGNPKESNTPSTIPIDWYEYQKSAHDKGRDGGVGKDPMGELKIEGIYPLAYIHMLTGSSVKRVFARTASHFHQVNVDNNVEDLASMTLEMDQNMIGSVTIGRIGKGGHPDGSMVKISIIGSKGALVINESLPRISVYNREQTSGPYTVPIANEYEYLLVDAFLQTIETDAPSPLDAKTGRDIAATVQAALESSINGKPVSVQ